MYSKGINFILEVEKIVMLLKIIVILSSIYTKKALL